MSEWYVKRRYCDALDRRRVEVRRSPDGTLYRHYAFFWVDAAPEDEGVLGAGYWTPGGSSGYFGTLRECEMDARREHGWISDPDTHVEEFEYVDEAIRYR